MKIIISPAIEAYDRIQYKYMAPSVFIANYFFTIRL